MYKKDFGVKNQTEKNFFWTFVRFLVVLCQPLSVCLWSPVVTDPGGLWSLSAVLL